MTKTKPEPAAAQKTPEPRGENLAYTSQTTGVVPLKGYPPVQVAPGIVIAPDSAAHAQAILKTGHFERTTAKATAPVEDEATAPAEETA
ncbi:hypothetical protein CBQ26_00575 [Deinococcus indicus]|uniref:Uncharacterized protein n=1 Tax=Deinococcus indicus TaxID=223556 RepID=A0A246BTI8_9DEIO|nr:hypothetical protein [Deinococcus indicus]OWL98987.1 hypothetical protein CBQ26_00575 [Deinococcus indicus]